MSEEMKKLVLDKRKEGKLVVTTVAGPMSVDVKKFIQQPVDGILYDLNRLEEVALTFIDDPKWINDFAVALTIRELYAKNERLTEALAAIVGYTSKEETQTELWVFNTALRGFGYETFEEYLNAT